MSELLSSWEAIFPNGVAAGEDLIARWSEPQRRYHTIAHLERMLSIVDESADLADDPVAVRLACWFHDAVYDPTQVDNEVRSAELAATVLADLAVDKDQIAEVVRLVYVTASHRIDDDDHNGALLCDADLAILASSPEDYAAYTRAVRAEYQHVHDDAYRAGRIAVLAQLLDLPHLYHVPALRAAWEERARAQVAAEISELRASAGAAPPG